MKTLSVLYDFPHTYIICDKGIMATKDAAKEAVMGIAKEYGFIQPSSLDEIGRINPALRREIEESMLAKDKKIAHSIIT